MTDDTVISLDRTVRAPSSGPMSNTYRVRGGTDPQAGSICDLKPVLGATISSLGSSENISWLMLCLEKVNSFGRVW
jgi:hypothetical protein